MAFCRIGQHKITNSTLIERNRQMPLFFNNQLGGYAVPLCTEVQDNPFTKILNV